VADLDQSRKLTKLTQGKGIALNASRRSNPPHPGRFMEYTAQAFEPSRLDDRRRED
jgi:hypothetical protein